MRNDKKEFNNNLISIGNEIVSSNSNTKMLTLPSEKDKKGELNIKLIKPYNNSFRTSTISTLNDNKKSTYYNISKLNYKDGYILKDATNSNPGFGLWSIKLEQPLNIEKTINEENNSIGSYNYNKKLINDMHNIKIKKDMDNLDENEINFFDTIENNYQDEEIDKMMINKLTKRNNKLEKRYQNLLINYYEKENQYLSLERARKEYEKLINKNIQERNESEKNLENLYNNNQALINSISNARNEIDRLVQVIKETQLNMKNELEKYNNILKEEEEKRKNIINKIRTEEKQIDIYTDKIEGHESLIDDNSDKNEIKIKKEKIKEKEIKINKKKEYIKKLQEELNKLYILDNEKEKEKKDLFSKINEKNNDKKKNIKNIDKIFKALDNQEINNKWNEHAIKIRNNIIYGLKKHSNSK